MLKDHMDEHLDLLRLDAVRAGEASEAERLHVESCLECREAVEQFASLASALRQHIDIPDRVDREILAMAKRPVQIRAWLSAAAVLLVAALGFALWPSKRDPLDLDRNGRVDIIDAYTLAVRVKSGTPDTAWDFNHDGRVDVNDVDVIARRAVALSRSDR